LLLFEEDIVRIQTQNIQTKSSIHSTEEWEQPSKMYTFTIVFGYTAKPVNFWIMLSIIATIFDFGSFHYQRTALHIAAKEGQKIIMEILVDKEADVNMKDNDEVSVYKTE